MENTSVFTEPVALPMRKDIAVKWGIITALVACVIITVGFKFVLAQSYFGFLALMFANFLVILILAGMAAVAQRKAMGGYISFKDAFSTIFIVLLIATVLHSLYGVLYAKYIDPDSVTRMKEATLSFLEGMKTPQEKLDETAAEFDRQQKVGMQPAQLALSTAKNLILYSLFGMIPAAIVKRKRPEGGMR
jgi:uncharacterized membrane protein (DUF106 family)